MRIDSISEPRSTPVISLRLLGDHPVRESFKLLATDKRFLAPSGGRGAAYRKRRSWRLRNTATGVFRAYRRVREQKPDKEPFARRSQ